MSSKRPFVLCNIWVDASHQRLTNLFAALVEYGAKDQYRPESNAHYVDGRHVEVVLCAASFDRVGTGLQVGLVYVNVA